MSPRTSKHGSTRKRKTKALTVQASEELQIEEYSPDWFRGTKENRALFLGNGFNISIGVDTSYENIFKKLNKVDEVRASLKKLLGKTYAKRIEKACYNLEYALMGRHEKKSLECKKFVRRELYRAILDICKQSKITHEAVEFFSGFKKFFTTNFDPLLYRFLETHRNVSEPSKVTEAAEEMKRILLTGKISNIDSYDPLPLDDLNKSTQRYIACKLNRTGGKNILERKTLERYLEKDRAGNTDVPYRHGFTEEGEDLFRWNQNSRKQNLFYLHGGLHMFIEKEEVYQYAITSPKAFINNILPKFRGGLCVFENKVSTKRYKIKRNPYLKHCAAELSKSTGTLCILGWGCNDSHLFNKNHFRRIYAGIHQLSKKVKEHARGKNNELTRYCDLFKDKDIIFFDVKPLTQQIKRKTTKTNKKKIGSK